MSILDQICFMKRQEVDARKENVSLEEIKRKIDVTFPPAGFLKAIKESVGKPALIAEVKKASPSQGVIREDFNPVTIAQIYQQAGATCLSVLTDEEYFQGRDEYLEQIKQSVSIPVLRKEFIVDEYQVYESRALGADAILLIMAVLTDREAEHMYTAAKEMGMDVLVEVHSLEELQRAKLFRPKLIGVNNRNLMNMEVSVKTSQSLAKHLPEDAIAISESGIADHETLASLNRAGYSGFLVGEHFMRQKDIAAAVKNLLQN